MNVYDILQERGFIQQVSHPELRDVLANEKVTFYIGFDATADSLHVGHFLQLIAMAHMQRAGHRPIALIGGGTTMVGDPSGKSDMRKMMTKETVTYNSQRFKEQISKFLDFSDGKAIMDNNANWLAHLNYLDFLRDVGVHFSVNRMLTAECFKSRLERGLTFMEFNYMLMQAYDFLVLHQKYGAKLQLGGDDQWSNILAGADLIRRKEQKPAFAMTFTLLTTSDGRKMGKTEKGAVWLDPEKTSPYEFYQYWRNVDDKDVEKCLSLLTFLPMDEVRRLGALKDSAANEAKQVLAFELTKQVHGEEEAKKAQQASQALFGGGAHMEDVPTTELTQEEFDSHRLVVELLEFVSLSPSRSEARRLIQGGGVFVDDQKVADIGQKITQEQIENGVLLRKGKKSFHKIILKA
ncbi:MAG: tyrosine--tRNA ligase [Christensenellales bacterium]